MEANAWKKAWENAKKENEGNSGVSSTANEGWKKAWNAVKEERDSIESEDASWKKAWDQIEKSKAESGHVETGEEYLARTIAKLPGVTKDMEETYQQFMLPKAELEYERAAREAQEQANAAYLENVSDFADENGLGWLGTGVGYTAGKTVAGVADAVVSLSELLGTVAGHVQWAGQTVKSWFTDEEKPTSFADQIKVLEDMADEYADYKGLTYDEIAEYLKEDTGKDVSRVALAVYELDKEKQGTNTMIDTIYAAKNDGEISTGAQWAGTIGYGIGNMVPSLALAVASGGSSSAGSAAAGGTSGAIPTLVSSLKSGASVGSALAASGKALFTFNASTALMSAQATGSKYVASAREYGTGKFEGATLMNAIGTGAIEGITENLGGITGSTKLGDMLNKELTGSIMVNVAQNLPNLLVNAGEEGMEEIIASPLEGLLDKAMLDGDKPLVGWGNGASIDGKEMLESGIAGAGIGFVMGSVLSTGSIISSSADITSKIKVVNNNVDVINEAYRNAYGVDTDVLEKLPNSAKTWEVYAKFKEYTPYLSDVRVAEQVIAHYSSGFLSDPLSEGCTIAYDSTTGSMKIIGEDGYVYDTRLDYYAGIKSQDQSMATAWEGARTQAEKDARAYEAYAIESGYAGNSASGADIATGNAEDVRVPSAEELRERRDKATAGSEPVVSSEERVPASNDRDTKVATSSQSSGLTRGADIETVSAQAEKYGRAGATIEETLDELVRSGLVTDVNALTKVEGMSIANAWNQGNLDYKDAQKKKAGEVSARGNSKGAEGTGQSVSGKVTSANEGASIVQNAENANATVENADAELQSGEDSGTINHDVAVLDSYGVSDEGKRAFLQYKSSESYVINEKLRNGLELSEDDVQLVRGMDEALEKLPTYSGKTYREIDFYYDEDLQDFLSKTSEGNPTEFAAYTSSAKTKGAYTLDQSKIDEQDCPKYIVKMELESKSGRDASNLGITKEREVIFPRNTRFFVERVARAGNVINIKATEVVSNGKQNKARGEKSVQNKPGSDSPAVRGVSKLPQNDKAGVADVQGVSGRDTGRDSGRVSRSHGGVSGGQRSEVRPGRPGTSDVGTAQGVAEVLKPSVEITEGARMAEAKTVSKRKLKPSDDESLLDKMTRPAIAIYDRLTGAGLSIDDIEFATVDGLPKEVQEDILKKAFTVYPDGVDDFTNMSDSAMVSILLSNMGIRVKKAKSSKPTGKTSEVTSTEGKPSERTAQTTKKVASKPVESAESQDTGKKAENIARRKLQPGSRTDVSYLGKNSKAIYNRLITDGLSYEEVKLGQPPNGFTKEDQEYIVQALLNADENAGKAAHIESFGDKSIEYSSNASNVAARLDRLGVKLKPKSGSQYNISGNGSPRNQYASKPKTEAQSADKATVATPVDTEVEPPTQTSVDTETEPPTETSTDTSTETDAEPSAATENADTTAAISMTDVIDLIQKDFGVQITRGYMRDMPKNAAGRYSTKDKGVRYRTTNDVSTVAHELGHALDDRYSILTEDTELAVLKWFANTLPEERALAYRAAYGLTGDGVDAYLPLAKEGLADRLADYLTDAEKALKDYPKFKPYFINQLSKTDRAKLERAAGLVHEAVTNDDALLRGTVHTIEKPKKTDSLINGLRQAFKDGTPSERQEYRSSTAKHKVDSFITLFFNKNQRLKRLGQLSKSGSCEAFINAQNATYNTGMIYSALKGDMTDLDGNVLGEGFHTILEGLTDKKGHLDPNLYHEFGLYLDIVHSAERQAQGHKIPQTMEKALKNGTIERMEKTHPNFKELSEKVYGYNNRLLDISAMYGLVDPTLVGKWRETYEHYVPMMRYFDEQTRESRGEARATMPRGFANINSPYKRAKGSQLDYYNPLDLIIQQTATVYQSAMHNHVMQSIVDLVADSPNPAILMEQIPDDLHVTKISTDELVDRLTKKVKKNSEIEPEVADGMLQLLSDAIPEYLAQVKTGTHTDASRRIVTVMENGQKVMYKVNDPELFKAIVNLNPTRDTPVVRAISAVSRGVVKMWTSLNPLFSVSNAARDLGTLTSSTLTEFGGEVAVGEGDRHISLKNRAALMGQMYKNIAKSYAQTVKERNKGLTATDPYHQEYIAMGGNESGLADNAKFMSVDVRKQFSKENSKRVFRARHGTLGAMRDGFAVFRYVSNMFERGPREAIYITAREMGVEPKLAYRLSQDTTTDFKNGGTLKGVSAFIPLWGAGLAGSYRAGRHWTGEHITSDYKIDPITSKSRQRRAAGRILASVILSIAGALLQTVLGKLDEDNYTKLSNYTKNNFYCIPLPYTDGKYFAIPKAREWIALQSMFERSAEAIFLDNENALDAGDTWEYLTDMFLPNGLSAVAQGDLMGALGTIAGIGPLIEVGANKDYLGRDIVPVSLQDVSPKYQYDENTSALAWALGQLEIELPLVGTLSPLQIDHIGRNWFGGMWEIMKSWTPNGLIREGDTSNVSFALGNRLVRDSVYSTDIINRMYDMRDAANIAKNDADIEDREDMDAEIDYKWYSGLASFYSRYNKLAKTEPDSDQKRATRQTVLDMIESSMEAIDGKVTTSAREKLEAYVERTGDTTVMPGVMVSSFKYGNKNTTYDLTADQYVEFQTMYNTYYWEYLEEFFANSYTETLSDSSIKTALGKKRDRALNNAKRDIVKKIKEGA